MKILALLVMLAAGPVLASSTGGASRSYAPVLGSLAISSAMGATLLVPAGATHFMAHISGDSGSTAYAYSSVVSASDALADNGDSFGHMVYGVGAGTYNTDVRMNPLENINGLAFYIYFATRGGSVTVHYAYTKRQ